MKKLCLGCSLSLVIGFLAAYFTLYVPTKHELEDDRVWAAEARLIYLNLLLKQKPEELQARLERGLEYQACMLSSDLPHHPGAEWFLWKTRDYCRGRSNSVPVGVWRYFDGLSEEKPWPQTLYYRGN